jgi:cytochrome P450
MEATLPLLVGSLLFFVVLFQVAKQKRKSYSWPSRRLRLPPGPWQLPVLGSLHHLLLSRHGGGLPHRALRELSRAHGPLMTLRLGAVPTLVVSSAEAAREVMKTHDAAFASRHQTPTLEVFSRGGRDILFSPYGGLWRQLRRLCVLELFSARRVASLRRVREEEAAGLLRSVVTAGAGDGAVVEIGELICRAMNDSVARSTVGGRCARRDEYLRELHRAARISGGFNLVDLYPESWLIRRLSPALREAELCYRNVRDIMAEIIREDGTSCGGGADEDHLLAVLLRMQKQGDAECPLTTEIITTVIMVPKL